MARCTQCGKKPEPGLYSMFGKPICEPCYVKQTGFVVGAMTGGAGGAAAGPGLFGWIRNSLRGRRR